MFWFFSIQLSKTHILNPEITLLDHAQKVLFKVPKICSINFWIENDPSPLWNFSKIHPIWYRHPSLKLRFLGGRRKKYFIIYSTCQATTSPTSTSFLSRKYGAQTPSWSRPEKAIGSRSTGFWRREEWTEGGDADHLAAADHQSVVNCC